MIDVEDWKKNQLDALPVEMVVNKMSGLRANKVELSRIIFSHRGKLSDLEIEKGHLIVKIDAGAWKSNDIMNELTEMEKYLYDRCSKIR